MSDYKIFIISKIMRYKFSNNHFKMKTTGAIYVYNSKQTAAPRIALSHHLVGHWSKMTGKER